MTAIANITLVGKTLAAGTNYNTVFTPIASGSPSIWRHDNAFLSARYAGVLRFNAGSTKLLTKINMNLTVNCLRDNLGNALDQSSTTAIASSPGFMKHDGNTMFPVDATPAEKVSFVEQLITGYTVLKQQIIDGSNPY